jgi:hypothetical protein
MVLVLELELGIAFRMVGTSAIGNLTIVNENITASGSSYGSGIGTGYADSGSSKIGDLTILNGNITAGSSYDGSGSGIGTGRGGSLAVSMIETLSVFGGRIRAKGTQAGNWIRF